MAPLPLPPDTEVSLGAGGWGQRGGGVLPGGGLALGRAAGRCGGVSRVPRARPPGRVVTKLWEPP